SFAAKGRGDVWPQFVRGMVDSVGLLAKGFLAYVVISSIVKEVNRFLLAFAPRLGESVVTWSLWGSPWLSRWFSLSASPVRFCAGCVDSPSHGRRSELARQHSRSSHPSFRSLRQTERFCSRWSGRHWSRVTSRCLAAQGVRPKA